MTTRHLYNNTAEAWKIEFYGGSLPDLPGAAWDDAYSYWGGTIPANSSCSLEFDDRTGSIVLTGTTNGWTYEFSTDTFASDPSWEHEGDTNGCALNDPADGDFQINQDVPM